MKYPAWMLCLITDINNRTKHVIINCGIYLYNYNNELIIFDNHINHNRLLPMIELSYEINLCLDKSVEICMCMYIIKYGYKIRSLLKY